MIYADNAATTKLDKDAFEAMKSWLLDEYGNASGLYSFSRKPKNALMEAREIVAAGINAVPSEIYFTSGGTESDNWAVKSVAFSGRSRHTIVTSAIEHHAILHSCKTMERLGFSVKYVHPTQDGIILPKTLASHMEGDVSLVSVMLANNEIGTIEPIRDLADIAHAHGALFHTDAVQAMGHIPIDVNKLGVDMLSASAHKFNGPKGIGFIYIRQGTKIHPYMDGGAQENGMRAGTENVAGIIGMAVALKNNIANIDANQTHIKELENLLLSKLTQHNIPYVRNGGNKTLPGIISLSFDGRDGEVILHRLDLMGICISTGSACNSQNTEISHVLKAIRLSESLSQGTIRIALGKNNTVDDIDAIAEALKKVILKNGCIPYKR